MTAHDVERALIQGLIGIADDRFNETIAAMTTDLQRLRDSWADSYAESRQAHEDRMAAMRNEARQALQSIATGEAAPKYVAAGGHEDAASVLKDASAGHNGLQQRPNLDPRAAELADRQRAQEMAAAVHDMDLADFGRLRAELGIGSATARGLFDS